MAKLWTPQERVFLKTSVERYGVDEGIKLFELNFPNRSREGIRSQLRLLKAGQEAAKSYVVYMDDSNVYPQTYSTQTGAKEAAKEFTERTGTKTTVAALICSFEVEQKIIEKTY